MSTPNAKPADDGKAASSNPSAKTQANNPPLTAAAKSSNEFYFFEDMGLSIHKEGDREKGRSMIQLFMKEDEDRIDSDEGDSEEENQALRVLEKDPRSHVADYHFSTKELEWIEALYKHSGQFLMSNGLKPFDDEDCRKGKAMVQQMMKR